MINIRLNYGIQQGEQRYYKERYVRGHVFVLEVSLPSLYQARKMRGHVFVCQRYRYQVCTKPGRREVIYFMTCRILQSQF
jgi:hypothetical protein